MKIDKKFLKDIVKVIMSKIEKEESVLIDTVNKLDLISKVYKENKIFRNVVLNPKVSLEEKERLLGKIKDILDLNEVLYLALYEIVKSNKSSVLKEIGKEFRFEVEKFFATLKGEVVAAHPLDAQLLNKIKAVVENKLGKKVEFTVRQDPSLIAGAVIRAGSYIIDTSIKSYLKKLEKELARF